MKMDELRNDIRIQCMDLADYINERCTQFYKCGLEDGYKSSELIGVWIKEGEEKGAVDISYSRLKCSVCGWSHSLVIPKNYCPNCGADMRKGII